MTDGLLLAVGTLTRIPVPAPRQVNRTTARTAMLLAPVIGLLMGAVLGAIAQLLADHTSMPTFLVAALAVAAIAWLTRALHLDGLADTADALGSGAAAPRALEIARRSDIGPFGVVTLVLVLLLQTVALADLLSSGAGAAGLVLALVTGRLAITLACTRGIPAARSEGLGATVAGSVPVGLSVVSTALWLALLTIGGVALGGVAIGGVALGGVALGGVALGGHGPLIALGATTAALAAGLVLVRVAVRRLGGITGDVLGAVAELATTVALVTLTLVSR